MIKYKMRYGQYESSVAKQLSIDYLGTVVYSGKTREIWVDGKCIAANYQGSVDELKQAIGELSNLKTTDKSNLVNAINELVDRIDNLNNDSLKTAEISTDEENGVSSLTIFGKKQTEGLVEDDSTKDFSVNIEGVYGEDNPLVTKVYVDNNIKDTKDYVDEQINKVLGGENLEATLDTIKEIQDELLANVKYVVTYKETEDSEGEDVLVERKENEDGTVTYVDENGNVVATETEDGITYEEGYSNLDRENIVETLMTNITENKENIENLESKKLVSKINVSENASKEFVTTSSEETTDEFGATTQTITIGVNYGTFKTGRGNVLDADSTAFVDGIATVKGVQEYIEERLSWDEFVSSADEVVSGINNVEDGGSYAIPNSSELDENIVIK